MKQCMKKEYVDFYKKKATVMFYPLQNRSITILKVFFIRKLVRIFIIVFFNLYIVSGDIGLEVSDEEMYEKGIRGFLQKEGNGYVLSFTKSKHNFFEGVFYKEIGTDFNNGIFKYVRAGKSHQVRVTEDRVTEKIKEHPNIKQ